MPENRRTLGWLPAVLVVVAVAVVWAILALSHDTPTRAVAIYVAYFIGCLAVPGTLVWKAVFGTRGWVSDLTWGAILGICLELVAWAAFSLIGIQSFLVLWPLLTFPILISRTARRRVLSWPPPPRFSLALTLTSFAVVSLLLRVWWPTLTTVGLPPTDRPYYVDIPWHLGLAHEATRAFPLQTPQLLDAGPLVYSWFVHAHLGAGSLITGIDVTVLMLRLWLAPMIVLGVVATALLARQLTGKAWAAGVAALLVASQGAFSFWARFVGSSNIFPLNSPTQAYSVPISLLCVKLIIDAFQRKLTWPAWALVALSGLVCAGSKSSIMLMVTAGVCGTVVVAVLLRKFSARMLIVPALFAALTLFAMKFVTGGGGGSSIQLFSSFTLMPPFRYVGGNPAFNELFADDLIITEGLGYWLFIMVAVAMVLRMLLAWVVVVVPFVKELRTNLAAWLLGGITVAAWVPFLLLSHRGYSQYYFMFGAMPFAAIVAAWWLSTAVPTERTGKIVCLISGGTIALATIVASLWTFVPEAWDKTTALTFLGQVGIYAGVVALLAVASFITRKRSTTFKGAWVAALLAPLLITPLIALPWSGPQQPSEVKPAVAAVIRAETEAALWVNEHVGKYDVMATNAACSGAYSDTCDARRWWLSGIGGRRVFIDGWRYVPEGADGEISEFDAQKVNNTAFQDPSEESIGELRDRGVTWMVVEALQGYPAPDLSEWGDVAYRNDLITIYHLR